MDTFCRRCQKEILEQESLDGFCFYIFRKPKEIRTSAELGCQACILFKANLKLVCGFEAQMESIAQAAQISACAVDEARLASQRGLDEINKALHDENDEEVQELKRGRILICLIIGRQMLALVGTSLMPWTPMVFVLRHPEDFERFIPQEEKCFEAHTGSDSTTEQARKWIENCIQKHSLCQIRAKQTDFRPKRLLELSVSSKTLYLRELEYDKPQQATVEYMTLSHCWGSSVPQQLTTTNIAQYWETGIGTETLGRTFQDAVKLCLDLNVKYIWIDSLCIVQDSEQDWLEQSQQMHQIYSSSLCNIAATSAKNGTAGCFQPRDPSILRHIKIKWTVESKSGEKKDISLYLTGAGLWFDRFEREPLNHRAWVLQERLLAPRVLHYDADQIAWECDSLFANEQFPQGIDHLIEHNEWVARLALDRNVRNAQEASLPGLALAEIWRPIVRLYSTLDITRWTDRLIALAGIGKRIEESLGWQFEAGMFLTNMVTQLMWQPMNGDLNRLHDPAQLRKRATRPSPNLAPSWSWLSLDGPVDFMPHWQRVMNTDSDDPSTAPFRAGVEPHLSPEQLAEEVLCGILGLKHGPSSEEAAGLRSTAVLQISCYLVPIALLKGAEQAQSIHSEDIKSWMNGTSTWNPYCFPYPDSASSQSYEALASGLSEDDAFEARKRTSFQAKLTWDIWDECHPEERAFLMPVHEITGFANQHYYDEKTERVVHGLLLYRAEDDDSSTNRFRRGGYLQSKRLQTEFWRSAMRCEPITGVELVAQPNVAVPQISQNSQNVPQYDKMSRQDGIPLYLIDLI